MDAKSLSLVVIVVAQAGLALGEPLEDRLDPPPVTQEIVARTTGEPRKNAPQALAGSATKSHTGSRSLDALRKAFLIDDPPTLPRRLQASTAHANGPIQQVASWSARRDSPTERPAATLLARAEQLAQQAKTRFDLTKVIVACQQGDLRSPEFKELLAWAYNRRGELAAEEGDHSGSINDFELAIDLDPEYWPAIHNRGITAAEQGRTSEAILDFTHVLELNPRFGTAYRNRGEAFADMGQLEKALFDYTAAIALGRVDPGLLTSRGAAHLRLGHIDRAVADFNLALQLDPDDTEALARRGDVYAQVGSYLQAVADLESAIERDPNSASTHRSLAWLLATCADDRVRDPSRAVDLAKRAVEIAAQDLPANSPGDGDLALHLDTLAVALAGTGDFQAAVRHAEHAAEFAPPEYRSAIQKRLDGFRRGEPHQPATVVR